MSKTILFSLAIIAVLAIALTAMSVCSQKEQEKMSENTIILEAPNYSGSMSLEELLIKRRSVRQYKSESISFGLVSQILWSAYGITKEMDEPAFLRGGLRTAPSAGALYPLEIYLVAGNVDGLKAGVYRYDSQNHSLIPEQAGDIRSALSSAAHDQIFIEQAPASIVFSAVFSRTTSKYGNRGRERYVCIDLGHSAQNAVLQTVALGLGCCTVGAFDDDKVKKIMNMPSEEEPLYIITIGRAARD